MRNWIALILIFSCTILSFSQYSLSGIITDDITNEPLIAANVLIKNQHIPIEGKVTDIDGKYSFEIKKPGVYTIEIKYIGYVTTTKSFALKDELNLELNFQMRVNSEALEEVVITPVKKLLKGKIAGVSIASPSVAESMSIRGSRSSATTYVIDGVRTPMTMDDSRTISEEESSDYKDTHKARQLTAAEWNDLNNWDAWKKFMKNPDLDNMQDHWQFFPDKRFSIYVSNKFGLPVADAKVVLKNGKETIWKNRTDNSGKAELWGNLYSHGKDNFTMEVHYKNKIFPVDDLSLFEKKINKIQLPIDCEKNSKADVMFVVDATGSMADEIGYLKTELKDVIQSVESMNKNLELRIGSVFYRDQGDTYVSRTSPLSDNIDQTLAFNNEQNAGGGGDFPEAVHIGLEKALDQDWSSDAIARIIFLVLDAPPHHDEEVMNSLRASVKKAAELGIKIIPISGSGINRHTEFLLKFMAMSTNGTYLFLTDDSGIGNAHLDPIVKDYEVEYLNEAMLRLIYYYTRFNGCEDEQYTLTEKNNTYNEKLGNAITLFPNPADNFTNIKSKKSISKLSIHDAGGRLVEEMDLRKKQTQFEVEHLPDGMYTIKVFAGEEFVTKQLLVIH